MKDQMIVLAFKKDSAIQRNSRINSLKIDKVVRPLLTIKKEKSHQTVENLKETLQKVKFGEKVL